MVRKWMLALVCLMLVCLCGTAAADQWGMSGEMSAFLKKSGEYDDVKYPELNSGYDAKNEFMIFTIRKGEENLLVLLRRNEEGSLEEVGRYPGALRHLPGSRQTEFWNRSEENGFRLKNMWGKTGEEYVFTWNGQDMVLSYANTGKVTITLWKDAAGYTVHEGEDGAAWLHRALTLAEFRMDLLPKSRLEAWQWDANCERFGEMLDYGQRIRVAPEQGKTLPVYAAPFDNAWRGAEGKAAVSLSAPFDVLATLGDGWYMVEYEITRAERRIGFVQGLEQVAVQELHLMGDMVTLAENIVMTDDPHGSRREMTVLPAGAQIEVLGRLDACWLCVQTEIDQQLAWGFIPITKVEQP